MLMSCRQGPARAGSMVIKHSPPAESRLSRHETSRSCLGAVAGFAMLSMAGCILRPGVNSDCAWPPEPTRTLNLASRTDYRHRSDAELLEELVDRYRFHPPDEQRQCERRLVAAVAILHSVDVSDVLRAVRGHSQTGTEPARNCSRSGFLPIDPGPALSSTHRAPVR